MYQFVWKIKFILEVRLREHNCMQTWEKIGTSEPSKQTDVEKDLYIFCIRDQEMVGARNQSRSETMSPEPKFGMFCRLYYMLQFLTSNVGITEQALVQFLLIKIIFQYIDQLQKLHCHFSFSKWQSNLPHFEACAISEYQVFYLMVE